MIVTKDPAIAGSIKNIWKKSFNLEDPRYIDFFFRDIFKPEYGYAYIEDSKAVASVCRINHPIVFNGRVIQASMLSNICELPDYRRFGYIKQVLDTVIDACNHTELITLARADNEELLKPYGFFPIYQHNEFIIQREDVKRITNYGCAYEVSPIDMLKVYSSFIKRFNGFVARDIESFIQIKKEVISRGGKIIGYYDARNQIQGYAIILLQGREAVVSECIYLDSMTLIKLMNGALQERSTIHLFVSEAENLSVLFPNATRKIHDAVMVRLNSPELFSRLFNRKIHNVLEAYSLSDKPLYLNENY